MSKIFLLNDTSKEPHWGCQSAGGNIVHLLKNLDDEIQLKTMSVQESWKFSPCPNNFNAAKKLINSNEDVVLALRSLMQSIDLLVVNAEGTLLSNRPPVRNLLFFMMLAIQQDVPFIILNATINPYSMNVGEMKIAEICEFYKEVLPKSDLITVRESRSYQIARHLGASKVWHIYDSCFIRSGGTRALESNDLLSQNRVKPTCIVFGSVLMNEKNMRKLEFFLRMFQDVSDCEFIICSMKGSEFKFMRKLSKTLKCQFKSSDELPLKKLQNLIIQSDFCISGRYHGCLLSALNRVPFICYETHSERLDDFCRHLCYDWGQVKLFEKREELRSFQNRKVMVQTWGKRKEIKGFLTRWMPFIVAKARMQETILTEYWNTLRDQGHHHAYSAIGLPKDAFKSRAAKAAKLLPAKLRVLDIGGFLQVFSLVYEFSKYKSIDLLFSLDVKNRPLGQPVIQVEKGDLQNFESHIELDINTIKDFKTFGEFDVAVLLGVLPWLSNWMKTLDLIKNSGVSYFLISWDPIEMDRVAFYLKNFDYNEVGKIDISKKSRVILFKREK